ncbi:MAG: electron transfer flavoprotein subunit alpha [Planctomycetota bacterium]
MESILVLAHPEADGSLQRSAFEAVGAGAALSKSLGASLAIGLFGADTGPSASAVSAAGAERILAVASPELAVPRAAPDAVAIAAILKATGATLVIAPGTSRMLRALPAVAARLGARIDTKIFAIAAEGGKVGIQRPFYRQRMSAELSRTARPWILVLDPGAFAPVSLAAGSAKAESVPVEIPDACRRTRHEGYEAPPAGAETLRPDAELLLVAGAGWTKKQSNGQVRLKDAESLILDFLAKAKASLGSSKSLVDQGVDGHGALSFLTHLHQVGQTGATPRHAKGLATCCHGEEPHTVGWRFIRERRAVNLDANCGWAQGKADVLYVADAFEVLGKLNAVLKTT